MLSNFVRGVVITAIVTLGAVSSAHADFKVRLDNLLTPSGYDGAKSAGTIIVRVYVDGVAMPITESRVMNGQPSNSHDFTFGTQDAGYSTNDVRLIEVSMSGSGSYNDLFILDQIELFNLVNGSYTEVWSQGIDNDTGFCLSWEQGDGSSGYCYQSVALQGWDWSL